MCRQFRECENRGDPLVPLSFNLSRLDFDLCDIFAEVEEAAHEYGVPRHMLNVEITETALGTDPVFMATHMLKFHDAGYQVWMDDFGSGYSTLNALKDFDFDELKIDMDFLNRFGEKSKTILASVVDMAKKLGIQTLAEGVETEEHLDYLRRIGCEKMQGYYFGRPFPYDHEETRRLFKTLGTESTSERLYVTEIGAVNTLSLSERDLTAGNFTQEYVTSMPIATIEYANGRFHVLSSNRVFREGLANVGVDSLEEAERRINDPRRPLARQAQRLIETIETEKFARIDYIAGDTACVMRAKHITSRNGKIAVLISIDDTIEQSERKRHARMDKILSVMYTIYDHVDLIHLDDEFIEPVFGNIGLHAQFDEPVFANVAARFAREEVFALDRQRYIEFMDHASMIERINRSGKNYIADFFRIRAHGGDYTWRLVGLIHIEDQPGNLVMCCIRNTHWQHDGLLQAAFDSIDDDNRDATSNLADEDLTITDGSLWRALTHDKNVSLFWKDGERRFVGANQSFLDYYGFDSIDEIVGKTDEDMGWHIDPTPFMEDELRVLNEGVCVEDVAGQCIVHGEVHNIVANKRPVYRNGRIVGLVGYFVDIDSDDGERGNLPTRDKVTGVLNYTGLEAATWQYVDAFKRQNIDFAMISVNVESFQAINDSLGYAFGEKALKRVADELVAIAGHQRVIGHVYAERFVILTQVDSDEELQGLCNQIERRLMAIKQVDGTPCTIYAMAGFARFSKLGDVEAMKRYNRDNRLKRRDRWPGTSGGGDVITSSLL